MEQNDQQTSTTNYSENEQPKTLNGSEVHKETKPKKPKKAELYYQLHLVMNGHNFSKWPDFERNFHLLEDEKGIKTVIEELPNKICRYMSDEAVVDAIAQYCYRHLSHNTEAQVTNDEARACFKLWRSLSPTFEDEIVPVAQKSEDVLCWHRLDFDFEDGPTPTFDEMFKRATNALAIKCWIGSLFIKDADRQQYVWIYGQGNNGKGALARFLHKIMGPAYCAQQPPTDGDRFWTSGILGKRLVVFADCNDYNFPATGLFKTITGGDVVKIEEKGKQPYSAELVGKMLFLSNTQPNISGGTADLRRAIYSEFLPIESKPLPAKVYDQKLLDEGKAFLSECSKLYLEHCPDHGSVPVDVQGLEEIIEANEERYYTLFSKYFCVSGDSLIEPIRLRKFIPPERFQEVFQEQKFFDFKKQRAFFEYIGRNFAVRRMKVKLEDGTVVKRYIGAREKTQQEKETHRVQNGAEPSRF